MISLEKNSGLPLKIEGNRLFFEGLPLPRPDARLREELKAVLLNPKARAPKECYFMYRDICLPIHRAKIEANRLRYDITVIPALMIGSEFNKTVGHFHPPAAGSSAGYPELYEVLRGKAHCLLQRKDGTDAMVIEAAEGQKVVVPPDYGHVTINPDKSRTLVIANWVERNFKSDYGLIRKKKGAMYYETTDGWVKNRSYRSIPPLRRPAPQEIREFGVTVGRPIYLLVDEIEKLDFLKAPAKYSKIFAELYK